MVVNGGNGDVPDVELSGLIGQRDIQDSVNGGLPRSSKELS